jgi:hypothetical protein
MNGASHAAAPRNANCSIWLDMLEVFALRGLAWSDLPDSRAAPTDAILRRNIGLSNIHGAWRRAAST